MHGLVTHPCYILDCYFAEVELTRRTSSLRIFYTLFFYFVQLNIAMWNASESVSMCIEHWILLTPLPTLLSLDPPPAAALYCLGDTPLNAFLTHLWMHFGGHFIKNLYVLFSRMVYRCEKRSDFWAVPSFGWAEIEKQKVYNYFTFSISSLPPEGVFELWLNVFPLWTILKKIHSDFWKMAH